MLAVSAAVTTTTATPDEKNKDGKYHKDDTIQKEIKSSH
jgi:hypothetical protein